MKHRSNPSPGATDPPGSVLRSSAPPSDGASHLAAEASRRSCLHRSSPGRRELKKLETRRRIFQAAFELFAARGFDGTTVEEIAERAEVAKGTVFNYFPHKTAFLLAAHWEWMARLDDDLGPADSWEGSTRARLERVLGYLADLSSERKEISRMVIFESMREAWLRMGTAGAPDPHQGIRLVEELTEAVIRRGKCAGEVRPDVDEKHAASLIAATAFSTLVRWLVKGGSAAEMKAAMAAKMDIIFTGLDP